MGTFFWREKLWNLTGIIWSIIQPSEHNFEHNAPFSRVTPKSIMLDFTSIIRLTLVAIACRIKRSRSTNYVQKINVAFPDSFRSSYYNTWKKTNTRSQIDVGMLPSYWRHLQDINLLSTKVNVLLVHHFVCGYKSLVQRNSCSLQASRPRQKVNVRHCRSPSEWPRTFRGLYCCTEFFFNYCKCF